MPCIVRVESWRGSGIRYGLGAVDLGVCCCLWMKMMMSFFFMSISSLLLLLEIILLALAPIKIGELLRERCFIWYSLILHVKTLAAHKIADSGGGSGMGILNSCFVLWCFVLWCFGALVLGA